MKKHVSVIIRSAAAATGVFAGSVAAYLPFVIADANKGKWDSCDYLLILGGDIYGADTPSPQLFERMKSAVTYLSQHKNTVAIPCGGCFRKLQKKSEAQIIADYLIANGIGSDRIILEDRSTTTFENFANAKKILEKETGKPIGSLKVGFLTSTYHIHRSEIIAKHYGIVKPAIAAAPTPGEAFKRYIREYFVAYDLFIRLVKGE